MVIKMIHLVFLAPYEELCGVIEQVFSQLAEDEPITHEVMPDQFNNPLEAVSHGDAVISRGFTALTLRRMNQTYAELKTTGYDVIAAVDKCLRLHPCKKIAIVGALNMVYGSESINCVYRDIEIVSYTTDDELKLRGITAQAVAEGAQAIVGGCSTVAMAAQFHVPAVLIESGKEAIRSAIYDAIQTVHIARTEKQKSSEVANIMNYSFQGIISTNREGMITLSNRYCTSLLGRKLEGEQVERLFPEIPFHEVIGKGKKVLSEIHHLNGVSLMVNCVPIDGKEQNAGCVLTFQNVTQIQKEEEKIRKRIYNKGFVAKYQFEDICNSDPATQEVLRIAESYSRSDSNLLILGETGVGKELFAQSVHNASRRRKGPFVAINCAALPEELLESELFGYVEGAFTGAAKGGKIGLFEIAHKGTIFLDEIGDISLKLQGRLLRVLQEREILRLGHDTVIPIDVRIISATNKDLREEVGKNLFRQDLLYRLDVLRLSIPPLRRRPADIPCLIAHFLEHERQRTGCILQGLEPGAQKLAQAYDWPGNVRELRNFCERLGVLCQRAYAGTEELSDALEFRQKELSTPHSSLEGVPTVFDQAERDLITQALAANGNNRQKTADFLGIHVTTLWRKMKKLGIFS